MNYIIFILCETYLYNITYHVFLVFVTCFLCLSRVVRVCHVFYHVHT